MGGDAFTFFLGTFCLLEEKTMFLLNELWYVPREGEAICFPFPLTVYAILRSTP